MHVTDLAKTQREDPVLNTVLDWLEAWKKTDLKTLLGEHASSVGWPTGLEELPEFCDPPKNPLPMHYTQGWEWGFDAVCGPKGTSGHCSERLSLRCWTSGPWLYLVFTAGVLLVAWDGQPGATSYQKLSTVQGWPAQGPFTPHCGYCSPGSPTCWLHQHRDHFGARPVT